MLIRPLQSGDRAAISEMLKESRAFNDEEIRVALEVFDAGVAGAIPQDYFLFGLEAPGGLLGYVCVGPVPMTRSSWDLYWICARPSHQRHGVGRRLVAHAEGFVAGRGGRRLVAETSGRPDYAPAHQFYAALGYQLAGRIPDYYQDGDDGLIFCKTLPPTTVA